MTRLARIALAVTLLGVALLLGGVVWLFALHPAWVLIGVGVLTAAFGLLGIDVDDRGGG